MVQDNNGIDPDDQISQDQQGLDRDQGITPEGDGGSVPTGPTNQQLADANLALTNQVRGLQSKVDTGLNSIRADTQAWMAQWSTGVTEQLRAQQAQQADKEFLAGIEDDEQRNITAGLITRINQTQQPVQQQPPQPVQTSEQASAVSPNQQILDAWKPYQEFAERMGVSGTDSRIPWSQFADANQMPDANKMQAFTDHIATLRVQSLAPSTQTPAASPGQTPSAQPNPQGDNPPVQESQRAAGQDLRTVDTVRDAYLEGRIPVEDYQTRKRALGEPV